MTHGDELEDHYEETMDVRLYDVLNSIVVHPFNPTLIRPYPEGGWRC